MRTVSVPPLGMASRRIDGEIDDHLLELVDVDLDQAEVAAMHDLELDLLAEQPAEQIAEIGEHVGERQYLRPQRLAPREGQKLAHQIGGAIGVLLDVHDVGEGRIGRPVLGEQQIGKADDGGQHIVEVMRDAAGELADRLHLLALRELDFERLVLGRIEGVDEEALVAARMPRRSRAGPSAADRRRRSRRPDAGPAAAAARRLQRLAELALRRLHGDGA